MLGFLKDDVLAAARPEGQEGGLGVDVTVRKALDAAEPKIAERFKDQPIVEAEVRDTPGSARTITWVMPRWRSAVRARLGAAPDRARPDHPEHARQP